MDGSGSSFIVCDVNFSEFEEPFIFAHDIEDQLKNEECTEDPLKLVLDVNDHDSSDSVIIVGCEKRKQSGHKKKNKPKLKQNELGVAESSYNCNDQNRKKDSILIVREDNSNDSIVIVRCKSRRDSKHKKKRKEKLNNNENETTITKDHCTFDQEILHKRNKFTSFFVNSQDISRTNIDRTDHADSRVVRSVDPVEDFSKGDKKTTYLRTDFRNLGLSNKTIPLDFDLAKSVHQEKNKNFLPFSKCRLHNDNDNSEKKVSLSSNGKQKSTKSISSISVPSTNASGNCNDNFTHQIITCQDSSVDDKQSGLCYTSDKSVLSNLHSDTDDADFQNSRLNQESKELKLSTNRYIRRNCQKQRRKPYSKESGSSDDSGYRKFSDTNSDDKKYNSDSDPFADIADSDYSTGLHDGNPVNLDDHKRGQEYDSDPFADICNTDYSTGLRDGNPANLDTKLGSTTGWDSSGIQENDVSNNNANTGDIDIKIDGILVTAWKIQIDMLKHRRGRKSKCSCDSAYNSFIAQEGSIKENIKINSSRKKKLCCLFRELIIDYMCNNSASDVSLNLSNLTC